jgi:hypothetical protein
MSRPSKFPNPLPEIVFESVYRTGDLLHFRIGGMPRIAKASLSRLLQQFQKNVDFIIITSYQKRKTEQENIKTFQDFPREYRGLVGTMKIGAFELVGHWQKKGYDDTLERSWFFTNGDPNLSTEDFTVAAQALASQYEQQALIVSRQGVITLETPEGVLWETMNTAGAIEQVMEKLMKARAEFDEGKRPAHGWTELQRLKGKGRDSAFFLDQVPDADQATPEEVSKEEEGKTSSLKPCIFVGVPGSQMGQRAFSIIGMDYPDWPILEK